MRAVLMRAATSHGATYRVYSGRLLLNGSHGFRTPERKALGGTSVQVKTTFTTGGGAILEVSGGVVA